MVRNSLAAGDVLTWLSLSPEQRSPALLRVLRESTLSTVTNHQLAVQDSTASGTAHALRATLPEDTALSAEHRPTEWLDRLTVRE